MQFEMLITLEDVYKTVKFLTTENSVIAGQSIAGQSIAGQSIAGQSIAGQSIAGQSIAGQSIAGQSIKVDLGFTILKKYS